MNREARLVGLSSADKEVLRIVLDELARNAGRTTLDLAGLPDAWTDVVTVPNPFFPFPAFAYWGCLGRGSCGWRRCGTCPGR